MKLELHFFSIRDKKKDFGSNCATYCPLCIILPQRKINHIARFMELSHKNSARDIPLMLVVNLQDWFSYID
nr:hypothetical protein CFP56_65350 [Quercus suber]